MIFDVLIDGLMMVMDGKRDERSSDDAEEELNLGVGIAAEVGGYGGLEFLRNRFHP